MLPAGPRAEWSRCPITREVLHCCARGAVESGVSGQSKPYLSFAPGAKRMRQAAGMTARIN
jgi:hypothetical protein